MLARPIDLNWLTTLPFSSYYHLCLLHFQFRIFNARANLRKDFKFLARDWSWLLARG